MCTVSWVHNNRGYQLLCNRDEKLTRKPAIAPRLAVRDGIGALAPIDGDFGGSWIGVNEFGVSVCLLNGANLTEREHHSPLEPRSRGLFLLELLPLASVTAICERVREDDLAAFPPFTVVALETGRPTALIEWSGLRKSVHVQAGQHSMLTSSSFDTETVRKRRQHEYARATQPLEFHYSHGSSASAYSPCMHRPDATTVSFSWIRVSELVATFYYAPGAPCQQVAGVSQKLLRRPVFSELSSGSIPAHPNPAAAPPATW